MPVLRLSLLGGFAVEFEGKQLNPFRSDKERLLLAYLAVEGGRFHRRETLAGLFWPESTERRAHHSLSQALYALRMSLQSYGGDSFLELNPQEVRVLPDGIWLDVREFEALLHPCDEHDHSPEWPCRSCLESLERAAALYRGDFLAGFGLEGCAAFEEWMLVQQEAARQEMIKIVGRLSLGFEAFGEIEKALVFANQWVGLDPFDEAAHRQVMRLLARQGRRQDALAQYAVCQKVLAEGLGIEPGAETIALCQQILEKADVRSFPAVRHNLPVPLIPLVGRQAELEKVCLKLAASDCRLLTVLGAGGVGKSRLALEAGYRLLPAFPDGVFLVELDTRPEQQSLVLLIARAVRLELDVPSDRIGHQTSLDAMLEQLSNYLENQNLLLILDGFEGVLSQSNLVRRLLSRTSRLKIMTTSRARLNLDAEHILFLEGLACPEPFQVEIGAELETYGAVQLFLAAAQRSDADFSLTEANQQAVAEICRLIQGIPLGILLAAVWVGMLTPAQIVQEIQRSLDFLASDWPGFPDRQRSLRATFDYSFDLLTEAEKSIFVRLSVFHSPFTAQRAAQVTGASLHQLRSLMSKSLLIHASNERYRMHDLLREYAQEKLDHSPPERQAIHERHSRVYLQALADWEPRLKCREQPDALQEIDWEYTDILAAWEWAVENGLISELGKTGDSFYRYHLLRGSFSELENACQQSLQWLEIVNVEAKSPQLWLRLATTLARACFYQSKLDLVNQIVHQIEDKLQLWDGLSAGVKREVAVFNLTKGDFALTSGNHLQALADYQQGLELMYADEDPWDISWGLCCVASGYGLVGNIRELGRLANEALTLQEPQGDPKLLAEIYQQLLFWAVLRGDYQAGLRFVQEELQRRGKVDSRMDRYIMGLEYAIALIFCGQYEQAREQFEQQLSFWTQFSPFYTKESVQQFLTTIDLLIGNYAAVLEDANFAGQPISEYDRAQIDHWKAMAHLIETNPPGSLDQAEYLDYDQAERELLHYLKHLRSLPRLDWVGAPLALLGYRSYRLGRLEEARQYLEEALENGLTQGLFWVFMLALSVLAVILAENGELEEAVELYATAAAHPCAANSRWWEDMFGRRIAALTNSLPADALAAAQSRGRARSLEDAGQECLEWLRASASSSNLFSRFASTSSRRKSMG